MESQTKQKVWFVTGASKGLGLELVQQLIALNQKVAATSRSTSALVDAVGSQSKNFLPLEVNLASDQSVKQAIAKAHEAFGSIDVTINNAGYGIGGSFEELTDKEIRDSFDINVFGTINVIRHALPYMREQKSGHIMNVSSIAGSAATTGWAAYAATKFAVTGLTEVLNEDVREFGIKATVVIPGAFRTSFLANESINIAKEPIAEYTAVREAHNKLLLMNGKQVGNPKKAAKLMIETGLGTNPPVHLYLGSDAYKRALEKVETLKAELEDSMDTAFSTDFNNN